MAIAASSVNNRPSTGSVAMFLILQTLVAAGWTVETWSDGTSYHSSPPGAGLTGFTSGASGTGGLGNNYAWFRIQDPGGGREFIVERGTVDYQWAIAYSVAAKFTGGSPAATLPPTATDGVNIIGAPGNGGGGTYTTLFPTSNFTYTLHAICFDSTLHYSFMMYAVVNTATTNNASAMMWFMDYTQGFDTGDLDPTVHYAAQNGTMLGGVTGSNAFKAYYTSISGGNFVATSSTGYWTANSGGNYWNGLEDILPIFYFSSSKGWKGWSSMFSVYPSTGHNIGDAANVGASPAWGAKNRLEGYGCLLPWPAGVDGAI